MWLKQILGLSPTQGREHSASPLKVILDASMTSLEGQAQGQNSMQKYMAGEKQFLLHREARTISGLYFHIVE